MKLVILGRDGVLNEPVDGGIRRPGDWRPIAGSLEAVAQMTQSGIRVCVVTHQPLLGSGEMAVSGIIEDDEVVTLWGGTSCNFR